ncbi:MAG: hypothetical protein Q9160_000450 [Pyrenula sp. 1 TL-2023]
MSEQTFRKGNAELNDSEGVIESLAACMVLSFFAVAARLASRRIQNAKLQASDSFVAGGLITAWIYSLITIEQNKIGTAKHFQLDPMGSIRKIQIMVYVLEMLYGISLTLTKLSILLLFRSLFPGRDMVIATNIIGAFVIIWCIAQVTVAIFNCNPIHGFWDVMVKSTCIESFHFLVGNAVPNIVVDIVIICLPIRKVWNLQMSTRSKISVTCIFLLGIFVVIVSGLRIYFSVTTSQQTNPGVALWTGVEVNVAVVCACLPTIRPVLSYLFPTALKSALSSKKTTSAGSGSRPRIPIVNALHQNRHLDEEFQRLPEYQYQMDTLVPERAYYGEDRGRGILAV